jgi:FOG: GGDEF domain
MQANEGKSLSVELDGAFYARIPVKTHVITDQDTLSDVFAQYVAPIVREGDIVFISEKAVACTQKRAIPMKYIHPRPLARFLCKFVQKTPYGIGLGIPETMEMALQECGTIRILFAAVVSAVGKLFGKRGWFYIVAGDKARAIDGPCDFTLPPYNEYVVLGPLNPDDAAREGAAASGCRQVAVVDANDLGCNILGVSDPAMDKVWIARAIADNPLGQTNEQTPIGIIRRLPETPKSPAEPAAPLPAAENLAFAPPAATPALPLASAPALSESPEYDELCNLRINHSFQAPCSTLLHLAGQVGQTVVGVRFDIDRFRYINNLKGPAIGDYVLRRLAGEAGQIFPPQNVLTRISADHFFAVFVMPLDTPLEEILGNLHQAVDTIRSDIGMKGRLNLSIGVALSNAAGNLGYTLALLEQRADLARRRAKAAAAALYIPYSDQIVSSYQHGASALDDYTSCKYADDIALLCAPIVQIDTGKIVAARIVCAWANDAGADTSKMTAAYGRLPSNHAKVLFQTCAILGKMAKSGTPLVPLYAPLPASCLYLNNIDEFLLKCVSDFSIEPQFLGLVVDASAILLRPSIARAQIECLRAHGFALAIMDTQKFESFNAIEAFSDLQVHLPFPFPQDMAAEPSARQALQQSCSALLAQGLSPVFLDIQNLTQSRQVLAAGALLAEGRFAGLPVAANEFVKLLHADVRRPLRTPGTAATPDNAAINPDDSSI